MLLHKWSLDQRMTFRYNANYLLWYANLAHLVEQLPRKEQVIGSSPVVGFLLIIQWILGKYKLSF